MKILKQIVICLFVCTLSALTAHGQAAPEGNFDPQAFEQQARQILQQMQQPNADQQQVMSQFRDLMRQFRDATQNMTPDQADRMRQQVMQDLQPDIAKSMPSIVRRMQQGIIDRVRQELDCTDEEFAAIKPGLQKILDCMQAVTVSGRGGRFGPPSLPGQSQILSQALHDLRATLDDTNAKPDEIKAKLDAVRQAKAQAEHDLEVARAELRPLLTLRQEAVLAEDGLLD
jgi:hypothetical protein